MQASDKKVSPLTPRSHAGLTCPRVLDHKNPIPLSHNDLSGHRNLIEQTRFGFDHRWEERSATPSPTLCPIPTSPTLISFHGKGNGAIYGRKGLISGLWSMRYRHYYIERMGRINSRFISTDTTRRTYRRSDSSQRSRRGATGNSGGITVGLGKGCGCAGMAAVARRIVRWFKRAKPLFVRFFCILFLVFSFLLSLLYSFR